METTRGDLAEPRTRSVPNGEDPRSVARDFPAHLPGRMGYAPVIALAVGPESSVVVYRRTSVHPRRDPRQPPPKARRPPPPIFVRDTCLRLTPSELY